MKRKSIALSALLSTLLLSAGLAWATDSESARERDQTQKQEQVYGSQLMTQQERAEYHAKMRAAKTAAEQEQIRKEHHDQMKARAKARGVMLPEEPPARGEGMGPGNGMRPYGGGIGPDGGGMGPGGGRR